jgi:hypothetical protein
MLARNFLFYFVFSYIITCGGEGDIRIWTGIEDDEASDKCVGEKAFAVCQRVCILILGLGLIQFIEI